MINLSDIQPMIENPEEEEKTINMGKKCCRKCKSRRERAIWELNLKIELLGHQRRRLEAKINALLIGS